ncbi:MAG TPA: ATP-binding protein [Smithellaceae bacterium]|jgi:DNA helicase HerA-like ATPase|nr:ATP-binding protein [Smithellaceae bacterium]
MTTPKDLNSLVDQTERLGVVGSPSSTSQLAIDILGSAVTRKLVGELALFRFLQDSASHYALGQITEIQLRNIWHEDPTMRSLIRQRGRVDPVSERQDTHLGQMVTSAVFRQGGAAGYEPSILGTVPSTGTPIHIVTDEILDEVLSPYRDQIFYLGNVYGSIPKLPLWFKHFDRGPDGAGEAYHIGIFGKTGSGKSVLAKMILMAYARYPKMALLVIDPQGEFSREMKGGSTVGEFPLPIDKLVKNMGKESHVMTVRDLVLDRWELFEQILYESLFFERLTIPKTENRELACKILSDRLKKARVNLKDLSDRESFYKAWRMLAEDKVQKVFYRSEGPRERFNSTLAESDPEEFFRDYWSPVTELFREDRPKARTVNKALAWLLNPEAERRPMLIVDLSKEQAKGLFWNDTIQALVIKRLLDGLNQTAEYFYKEGTNLNALVVIDEAHRLAPRDIPSEDNASRGVRSILIDAARTTRKYGLGWLFISQTLSSLHMEIIQQLRIFFFGFGLGLGQEFQALRQLVGSSGTALDLYQLFRDPHSAFDISSRQYSFMTIGPVSPLSFSGTPLFFNAFNTVKAFLATNRLRV